MDDSRTHNAANELTGRDTDRSGVDNYALTYDAAGNLTNDGQTYKFEYDAFGRLRKLKDQSNNVVEEFRYNGLNHRIAWLYDADADNDVDGADPWFYFVYDRSWRMVASYRGSDSEAKELFVNHQAGLNGSGLALPLDAFILRDRNTSAYWAASVSSFSGERRASHAESPHSPTTARSSPARTRVRIRSGSGCPSRGRGRGARRRGVSRRR